MSNFSTLVEAIQFKRDKLGRPNSGFEYINRKGLNAFKNKCREFDCRVMFRYTKSDKNLLIKRAKDKKVSVGELIRTYIEWGLENEE